MTFWARRAALVFALVICAGAAAYALQRGGAAGRDGAHRYGGAQGPSGRPQEQPAPPPPADTDPAAPAATTVAGPLRYVAVGGGSAPESTEVSLEQNLALLTEVLPGPGTLLFAGGRGSQSVRELDPSSPPDPLLVRLGDLFEPRLGRGSRYRASELDAGAADLATVESRLRAALAQGDDPLILFFATHGEQGEAPRDNSVVLWGGGALDVARLAELHAAHPRPLRVISASCFSGGFAELAFTDADAGKGAAREPRCGLFAGTWDRETSGCDPDPDRRRQEGYGLHFLHALRGRDRHGAALPPAEIDFDGDGKISLLEAHTRAAIAARSIDVPTTTSQRYLRAVAPRARGRAATPAAPEERALVQQLGAALGLGGEVAAQARARDVQEQLRALDARLQQADAEVDERFAELSARLLGRWPVLDDAYHPQFAPTLARDRARIAAALDRWPEALRFAAAEARRAALERELQELEVEEALVARLLRAHETLRLAGALHARGGPQLRAYQGLLACERLAVPR